MTDKKYSTGLRNNSEDNPASLSNDAALELYHEIKKALDTDEREGVLTEEEAKWIMGIE